MIGREHAVPNTTIRKILSTKGQHVATADKAMRVTDVVTRMNQQGIGSVVVIDDGKAIGIFTERDVLTRVVAPGRNPRRTRVAEVMSVDLLTLSPDDTVDDAVRIITKDWRHHLPVLDSGTVCGIVSSSDLTRWLLEERSLQIRDLEGYITRA